MQLLWFLGGLAYGLVCLFVQARVPRMWAWIFFVVAAGAAVAVLFSVEMESSERLVMMVGLLVAMAVGRFAGLWPMGTATKASRAE